MGSYNLTPGGQRVQINSLDACKVQALCREGRLDQALDALLHMDQQDSPHAVHMYKNFLQACMKMKALSETKQVYAHLVKHGLGSNRYLMDLVVTTLVKCGSLADGLKVFQRLSQRTAFSWTAIISGYVDAGQCQKALFCYEQMQWEGVQPDKYTVVSLLKACSRLEDLQQGKRVHDTAVKHGFESDGFVCTTLVSMYAKCGSMVDARNVFVRMPYRDVASWNAMLGAYAKKGQAGKAMELYREMQDQGIRPNDWTLVSALQACAALAEEEESGPQDEQSVKLEALLNGRDIHAKATQMGYVSDVFVGSALVSMYAKCGSLVDAQQVFNGLAQRDVVSWNAMIAALAQQGLGERALELYEQMRLEGINPDARTFVSAFQACAGVAEKEERATGQGQNAKVKSLHKGKQIHQEAARRSLDSDVFVGNTLISMYARCGSLMDAQQVFDGLSHRDVVSWTVLIAAYAQEDQGEKGLQIYEQMQEEGIRPVARTFVSTLQACGTFAEQEATVLIDGQNVKVGSLHRGKEIHEEAVASSLESDIFLSNTLVSTYAKCGSVKDAQQVFEGLPHRNVVSWNAMIAAYGQQEQVEEALQLYEQMLQEGVCPDSRTFASILQACGTMAEKEDASCMHGLSVKLQSLLRVKRIHQKAAEISCGLEGSVGNILVSIYAKCGTVEDAWHVFDQLSHRDVVSWNAIIAAYAQQDQGDMAWLMYGLMQLDGVRPDARTFVSTLQACGMLAEKEEHAVVDSQKVKVESLRRVKDIHVAACMGGFGSDVFVGNTLVSIYAKCGSVKDGRYVFDHLSHRNVVSWTSMIGGYAQQDQGENALQIFADMQADGVKPDEATFLSVLEACCCTGALDVCRDIHQTIADSGSKCGLAVATSLIHAYGKCGSMQDSRVVFNSLHEPDVVSWSALIAGYSRQGDCAMTIQCYKDMCMAGMTPNSVTFLAVLSACSYAGMVDIGLYYFESMTKDHGITPETEHYVCMIDLVGSAGLLQKAQELLLEMPMQPTLPVWLCLLGACRKHCNVALGRWAFDCAASLEPENSSAYVLMCNIYAEAGMLQNAQEIDMMRQSAGAWKKPGQSWIEHEEEMHTFLVGDCRHEQHEAIRKLLQELSSQLKEEPVVSHAFEQHAARMSLLAVA